MQKLISYPISVIYYLCFGLVLVIFHPIQWICFNIFGYQAHKKSVDYMNFLLVKCTNLLGTTYKFENVENIPKGVPLIFVSNHQSMYDIIAMIWYLRRFHCKFVSKIELGKGIPSVSYNLRHGAQSGLKILCKYAPSAYIVPISINNSWKIVKYGFFPLGLGNHLTFTVHKPLAVSDYNFAELMEKTENTVVKGIKF